MVRLGSGGLGGRALTEGSMLAALQALSKFKRLADSHDVDEIVAAATSAVREADNGREFLTTIRQRTGVRVKVISGTEEARLIHRAAVYGVNVSDGRAAVIDIGGGSVEFTLGTAKQIQVAESAKIGVIRLTEQFVRTDPIERPDERRMVKHIADSIEETVEQIVARGFDRAIGTSGTILSLGGLAGGKTLAVGSDDLRNRRISAKQFRRLRRELTALPLTERLAIPWLDPRRADLAVAGSILLDTILKRMGVKELTLCDLALREGLALDYIRRNQAHIAKVKEYPDVRCRSAVELAERCNYSPEHARQVTRLALAIFDQTRAAHDLGPREREWLEYGALLHDIGVHISYPRHHRHSYYLIKNGDLRGFEPEEVEVIALVARYHRRVPPKRAHEGYGQLPARLRRTVRTLSAMLRVAEGLDRSHQQSVGLARDPGGQPGLPAASHAGRRHRAGALGRPAERRAARGDPAPDRPLRGLERDRRRRIAPARPTRPWNAAGHRSRHGRHTRDATGVSQPRPHRTTDPLVSVLSPC
jgi:exopolyphosphatase/guanosine-5'-triphosphate,3'-diphosphate pyrophosphatase